jgi:hypothetical protein
VSPVRYELGFYISEDGILHSHRRENLKSYIVTGISLSLSHFLLLVSIQNVPKAKAAA